MLVRSGMSAIPVTQRTASTFLPPFAGVHARPVPSGMYSAGKDRNCAGRFVDLVGCPTQISLSGPLSVLPGVNARCAAVLPRMKPVMLHLPFLHSKRGESPKIQKS